MTVYVLFELGDYDEYRIIGVYKDKQLAETRKSKIEKYAEKMTVKTGARLKYIYAILKSQVKED